MVVPELSFGPGDIISCPSWAAKAAVLGSLVWLIVILATNAARRRNAAPDAVVGLALCPVLVACAGSWAGLRDSLIGIALIGDLGRGSKLSAAYDLLGALRLPLVFALLASLLTWVQRPRSGDAGAYGRLSTRTILFAAAAALLLGSAVLLALRLVAVSVSSIPGLTAAATGLLWLSLLAAVLCLPFLRPASVPQPPRSHAELITPATLALLIVVLQALISRLSVLVHQLPGA